MVTQWTDFSVSRWTIVWQKPIVFCICVVYMQIFEYFSEIDQLFEQSTEMVYLKPLLNYFFIITHLKSILMDNLFNYQTFYFKHIKEILKMCAVNEVFLLFYPRAPFFFLSQLILIKRKIHVHIQNNNEINPIMPVL